MARDGSGTYTRVSNSFSNPVAGTTISPTDADAFFDDIESEMTDSLSRSGKGGMSADLDMNNNDINEIKTAVFQGSTSGNTTVQATAIAGTTTLTLPAATDTLVGRATTDTLTNKTIDTAGPNTIKVNGNTLSASAGTATVTVPNSTDTLVGRATTDTLTNKTISGASNTLSNVALSSLASQAAYTLVGNATGSSAAPTAVDIAALTTKASPTAADYILISDQAASGALKKVAVSSVASAGSVSSIAGNTGAFTLSHGLTNSTNDIQIDVAVHRGYLSGLTLSTAGSSATFSVAAGCSVDDAQTDFMKLTSSISKTTSAWAVGTGNGALDTGAIANNTWYHVYEIKRPDTGVVDILVSTSASSPTMPTNYTLKRRIGAMLTNASAQWTKFVQNGDEFLWDSVFNDANAVNPGTGAGTLYTLAVPTGVKVNATIAVIWFNVSASTYLAVYSPDALSGSMGTGVTNSMLYSVDSTHAGSATANVRTDTSSRVRASASGASGSLYINTMGWVDRRGRDG